MKTLTLSVLTSLSLVASAPLIGFAADQPEGGSSAKSVDQTDSNYYWQGTQLYNLGRLGEAFDSFEKAIQRKQNTKEAEAYLLQIRQEIVTNAKKRAEERATLNYSGNSPDSALNVTYVQKGHIKVTLQAKYLFDENSASLKTASVDVLNRLAELVQAKEGNRVELIVLDELDNTALAKDIDAERSLMVFAYLNFKRINTTSPGRSSSATTQNRAVMTAFLEVPTRS
jgi:outer membrane protein OmpA-like peptidoglycan-associated protein